MECYCEKESSMLRAFGMDNLEKIIEVISDKYRADNPPVDFNFRAFCKNGILCNSAGGYVIDFSKIYSDSKRGDFAYAMTEVFSEEGGDSEFALQIGRAHV